MRVRRKVVEWMLSVATVELRVEVAKEGDCVCVSPV